jgi:hypothetical protein
MTPILRVPWRAKAGHPGIGPLCVLFGGIARRLPLHRFETLDEEDGTMTHFFLILTLAATVSQAAETRLVREPLTAERTVHVSGSGIDLLTTAIVHSKQPTDRGMVQRSTETVELSGDLTGRVLYHVTSDFDFVDGTLVNTGEQVFSGTVGGSDPVLIHDDEFQFRVNLTTGEESGEVYLVHHIAGPKVRCLLQVTGTGLNADGNPTFDYTGECTFRGE